MRYKKSLLSILLSFALLITMLPTSVSKAADNSVKVTQFEGDTKFYKSQDVSNSYGRKNNKWELVIHDKKYGPHLISESDQQAILDGLVGAELCLRSIVVEIKVTGEVSTAFTPYLHAYGGTSCPWGYRSNSKVGCTETCPKIEGEGTYEIVLTIDDTVKDCSDSILNANTAVLYVTTEENDSTTNDVEIELTSITFNKEPAEATDTTALEEARAKAQKVMNGGTTQVKGQYYNNYYPPAARNAVNTVFYEVQSIKNTNTKEEVDAATNKLTEALNKVVDVEDLWKACNTVIPNDERKNYTTESLATMDEAVNAALALSDDDFEGKDQDAAAEMIQNMIDAIDDAVENLKPISEVPVENPLIKKLKDAISPYRNWKEGDYTPETWADYKEARDAIQEVIDNPPDDLSEETVDDLIAVFKTATNNIAKLSNENAKAELQEVVDEILAKNYKEADYTAASWTNFDEALRLAQSYLAGNTLISIVNEAKEKLQQAEADLVKAQKVDKDPGVYLDYSGSWIKQGKNNGMTGYVADGSEAKLGTDDWWTDITGIDLSDLEYPVLEVEYVANGDTLQIVYNTTGKTGWDDANPVITSGSENSGNYKVSLADKKDMKYLFLSSNGQHGLEIKRVKIYDDAAGAVTDAKKALDASVSSANKLKKADYTEESWSVLEKALEDAKKITDASTVADINAAKKAVDDAVKGLKKIATPSSSPSTSPSVSPSVQPSVTPSATPSTQPSATPSVQPTKSPDAKTPLKPGVKVVTGRLVYKVTKAATTKKAGTLTVVALSAAGKKVSSLSLPATATIYGYNYKVTKIGNNALKGASAKSVAIGKNITAIPKGAFANCKKLTKLTVKAKLKSVKKGAFKGCKKTITVKGSTKKNRKANIKLLKKSGYKKFK